MSKLKFLAGVALPCGVAVIAAVALLSIFGGQVGVPAEQAMREAMQHCGKAAVVWQASSTNEPGVIWFSAKCEVQK